MSDTTKVVVLAVLMAVIFGMGVWGGISVTASPDELPGGGDPNIYELTRQCAENTRYIFILLCAGWVCLFGFYLPLIAQKYMY